MTKPFESIRQLFGRVLGHSAAENTAAHEYSTLGLGSPEAQPAANGHAAGFAVENSQPEIEAQTADTQRLPQVAPDLRNSRNGEADHHPVASEEGADEFGDALLDLGDVSGAKAFTGDDPFLDVLDEGATPEDSFVEPIPEATVLAKDASDAAAPVPAFEETGQWPVEIETIAVEVALAVGQEKSAPASRASPANLSDLSPEAIDGIARRVVAQLSDKAVREIAWEVVPEMAELMIKQKLEEE